jgi:hypothetical protein
MLIGIQNQSVTGYQNNSVKRSQVAFKAGNRLVAESVSDIVPEIDEKSAFELFRNALLKFIKTPVGGDCAGGKCTIKEEPLNSAITNSVASEQPNNPFVEACKEYWNAAMSYKNVLMGNGMSENAAERRIEQESGKLTQEIEQELIDDSVL